MPVNEQEKQGASTAQTPKESVENLIRSQKSLRDQMTKFIANTKKTATPKRTHGFYVGRINGWYDIWKQFLQNEDQISKLKTETDLHDSYFADDMFSQLEELYYEFKGELVDHLEKIEKETKSETPTPNVNSPNHSVTTEQSQIIHSNLPRISLPKFSGDYNEWVSFRDLFISVIHQNSNIEDVQKLHYLKSTLVGEAAQVIKQYSITNANYKSAWSALKQRYENKRVLVSSLLKSFTSQLKIHAESAVAIKTFLDTTNECLSSLNNLEVNTLHWDPLVIHILTQKLPTETHKAWEESMGESTDIPTWKEFKKFLEFRFRTLEAISGVKPRSSPFQDKKLENNSSKPKNIHNFHVSKTICKLCQGNHSLRSCPRFLKMDVKNRIQVAKSNGCCFNCLGNYHSINKCLSTARCTECRAKHHTLLHQNTAAVTTNTASNNKRYQSPPSMHLGEANNMTSQHSISNVLTHFIAENRQVLLATAIVYVQTSEGFQAARALIDPGSQATFITHSALRRMSIHTTSTMVKITGLGNIETASAHRMAQLIIKSPDYDKTIHVTAIALDTLTDILPSKAVIPREWEHLNGLRLADPMYFKPNRVDMILGADIFPHIILDGVKIGAIGAPLAQNTIFGWILSGQLSQNTQQRKPEIISLINLLDINTTMKKFWETEEVHVVKTMSAEDILCEDLYQTTHYRNPDGSYVVRLPLKPKRDLSNALGTSRHIALRRLFSVERSNEQKGFSQEYNNALKEYISSGHMEKALNYEKLIHSGAQATEFCESNYLPHHAVIKAASTTTKLRVVFDASCKTTSGKSLNDILMPGPTLQQDVTSILTRWRFHKYVFTADIEKMYRQIWIHPDDADFQRILWRTDKTDQVKDYRLLTVTFGVSCAPYLAIRTLHQLADDEKLHFPEASVCLKNDFYVDDVLTGRDTICELDTLKENLRKLLQKGGFNLRKFSSNNINILRSLPPEVISNEALLQFSEESTVKALGICWKPTEDNFQYKLNMNLNGPYTKRNVLSKIAKLFDPLGWLSPIVISAKIFMQKLWLAGLEWDQALPPHLYNEWQTFIGNLNKIEEIKIPRWIRYSRASIVELHGFCDSSERAYGAVIYVRIQSSEKEISTSLIMSKTRVAPIKSISLPRLELCGAHLLSKLVRNVRENISLDTKTFLWTDSTVVLAWLNSNPNRWKSFVANRVTEIHNNVENIPWRHVPSKDNPADIASRGISPTALKEEELWWKGPSWLALHPNTWPILPVLQPVEQTEKELKRIKSYNITIVNDLIIERFSNLDRACRVVAYCRRFITNCNRENTQPCNTFPSAKEIEEAKYSLIKESQSISFPHELKTLKVGSLINSKSSLLSLNPFLDNNGILRVGGRLDHSHLSFNEKHPIILSCNSRFTTLLIDKYHKITLHGGVNVMLYNLRKRYWIPGVKTLIRKHIHQCIICLRWRKECMTQIMGNLPKHRVTFERPFLNVGIDFAGPINIKLNRTRNAKCSKAYIAIFVCFAVKAVHIEAVSDLSSEAFLASLRRFFARRGLSKNIYSDNGTNFVGASKLLGKEFQTVLTSNKTLAAEYYANQNICWHFIPPSSPHFGGIWEAGVKSIKYHLRRIIGQTLLTFEELTTVLTQIEAILNSRPLCPLPSNPDEFAPLTPGHFLIGDALLSPPEIDRSTAKEACLTRWQFLQKLKRDFWKRWSSEYLSRLQQRPKWKVKQRDVRIGDLVLLKEDNLPPSAWKLARITELHTGRDNRVRVVTLKTQHTELKRPIVKICPLPFQSEDELLSYQ